MNNIYICDIMKIVYIFSLILLYFVIFYYVVFMIKSKGCGELIDYFIMEMKYLLYLYIIVCNLLLNLLLFILGI